MEEDKYMYIIYHSAKIKIKANEIIKTMKDLSYDEQMTELRNTIYEAIKIHPSFQHLKLIIMSCTILKTESL